MTPFVLERADALLFWGTALVYAGCSALYVLAAIFGSTRVLRWALRTAGAALIVGALQVGVHWYRAGHAPYITRLEVVSATVWVIAAAYLLLRKRLPELGSIGVFLFPVITLAMGWTGTNATLTVTAPPLSFATVWLGIHIIFTQLFVACVLFAAGIAFFGLTGKTPSAQVFKVPKGPAADRLIYQFTAAGFFFLTIMILAGSIWANHAWGRYWGWDNIEVWSLICWLVFASELHLMRTLGWRGRRLHWLVLATLGVALFSMFGVVLVFPSIHSSYMVR